MHARRRRLSIVAGSESMSDAATIVDYLREQAAQFRELAKYSADPNLRRQLFALAKQCEELALTVHEGPTYKKTRHSPR
jgi:hypothetical protein